MSMSILSSLPFMNRDARRHPAVEQAQGDPNHRRETVTLGGDHFGLKPLFVVGAAGVGGALGGIFGGIVGALAAPTAAGGAICALAGVTIGAIGLGLWMHFSDM